MTIRRYLRRFLNPAVQRLPGLEDLTDAEVEAVRELFDLEYYLDKYADIRNSGVDPFEHFMIHGWKEERNPSQEFDVSFYNNRYLRPVNLKKNPIIHYVMNRDHQDLYTNQDLLIVSELSVIDNVVDFIRHICGDKSVIDSDRIKNIVFPMFSIKAYRARTGVSDKVSDLECFVRYLVHDFSNGIGPGPLFDGAYYARHARLRGLEVQTDPERSYLHWLAQGAPSHISPVSWFDEDTYIGLNPDLRNYPHFTFFHLIQHGLREGRRFHPVVSISPVKHPLSDANPAQYFLNLMGIRPQAFQEISANLDFWRSAEMKSIMDRATALEPEIHDITEGHLSLMPPWHDTMYWYYEIICSQFVGQFDHVVLMPFGKMGGADYVGSVLANSLSETGRTVILRTDQSDWDRPDWFSPTVTSFDLSRWLEPIDPVYRKRILYEVVRRLRPRNVFNVNSYLAFETFRTFGARLQHQTNLFAYYFCSDRTLEGREAGYPVSYFANVLPFLKGAMFDTEQLARTISERYCLSGDLLDRVNVVYTPAMSAASSASLARKQSASKAKRASPVLIWAGRFDRQKRFDLLLEIARQMPDVTFRCWGRAVLDAPPSFADMPPNVSVNPPFKTYDELPLEEVDGFIYTSGWDGLPTILIELGAMGMPIVASAVGGVPELIDRKTGWPVPEDASVEGYVASIKEMLASPEERDRRSAELQKRVIAKHSRKTYSDTLRSLTAWGGGIV